MKVLAIRNCTLEGFGLYEKNLLARGIELTVLDAHLGDRLPPHGSFQALLVGGTPVSALEVEDHPFLRREVRYLRRAISAGKPCLGICCGGQILAQTLGGDVARSRRKEIGVYEVALTPAGREDSMLRGFPSRFPVFQWHQDAFEIPPGARLLVEGDPCRNQMFRRGNVVGVMFHLEVSSVAAASWADAYADELDELGKSRDQVLGECATHERQMGALAEQLLDNFLPGPAGA